MISGAGSGIGAAIAALFARQGAGVWIVDCDAAAAERVALEIRGGGGSADCAVTDVADEESTGRLTGKILSADVLVNNAGIGHVGNLLGTTPSDLDRLLAVNVRGAFNLCRCFVPGMLQRGRGSVINLASIAGVVAVRDRLAYTVSKHAIVGLTKALALDHSHTGVRFNAICPGRVETPFVQRRIREYPDPEQAYREMASTQLNGRMAQPEEIAAAALYLACDASTMVTGSNLLIDGGWSAGK